MASRVVKKRNWTFLIYPDSAPANWFDILVSKGFPFAVSPLHDLDVNEATGEQKKPHYHVLVTYEGPTSFSAVHSAISELNCPIPIPVESIKGAYRYLTHQDNPEKAQYSSSDIRLGNAFDISVLTELTRREVEKYEDEIVQFIIQHQVYEYASLLEMLFSDPSTYTHYSIAKNHTVFFNAFLTSRRHRDFPKVPSRFQNPSVDMGLVSEIQKGL